MQGGDSLPIYLAWLHGSIHSGPSPACERSSERKGLPDMSTPTPASLARFLLLFLI